MAAGRKAIYWCGHNPLSLEGLTVSACHLLPLLPQGVMLCLLVIFTLDEEALSRPSFCSSSTWPSFLDICLTSPTFALLSEYSCDLNVGFQSLVFARTRRCGRLSTAGRFAGDPGSAPASELHYVSQGSLPPLGVDPWLRTSVFSWLGWEPCPCQRAVTVLKNYFTLRCFSCHFPGAPSAPPGDHYLPRLKISWDGLWIQPAHLPLSVLSQLERWNCSPLVLWPTIFKMKIRSSPPLCVLWLLELFCFVLFESMFFFSFLKF